MYTLKMLRDGLITHPDDWVEEKYENLETAREKAQEATKSGEYYLVEIEKWEGRNALVWAERIFPEITESTHVGRYDYQVLKTAAINGNEAAVQKLGEWFELYDNMHDWNGECYVIDDNNSLYPLYAATAYDEDGDACEWDFIGYEIR